MDVYLKEGNSDYASVNPQNFRPVFTSEQLASSLRATTLSIQSSVDLSLWMLKSFHSDIRSQLREDPISAEHLDKQTDSWTLDPDGLLRNSGRIYVPDSRSLRLHVLQYSHNIPLWDNFGQTKTLHQVWMHYYWPGLLVLSKTTANCVPFVPMPNLCATNLTGLLKQLPIPAKPWNSISMDFIEKLPPSSSYTSILVIVDRLLKAVTLHSDS